VTVAAGGAGDAVAAVMLHAALYGGEPGVILTYGWERQLGAVGPRSRRDFTGLRQLAPGVWAVPPQATAVPPSTLPRLAARVRPHTVALLDPHGGAAGMARQLDALAGEFTPGTIDVLDTGGDILARGDEPALRSGLGDALTLAACGRSAAPVRLLVAGAGLDGELTAEEVVPRLGPVVATLTAAHAEPVLPVLEWHPSEAAALLAAAALGVRGRCELHETASAVPLTDDGPVVREAGVDEALRGNALARALLDTTGLDEAETRAREVRGYSELDEERARVAPEPGAGPDPEALLAALGRYEAGARARGATHATFRRVAGELGVRDSEELRGFLAGRRPGGYEPPLWRVGG
jgi:hypothetical protein